MLTEKFSLWLTRTVPNFGINSICELPIALGSDIGLAREENQDKVAVMRINAHSSTSSHFVVALADGMGGMRDGSECAARTLGAFFNALIRYRQKPPEDRLLLAANAANEVVYQYSHANGGATLSAVLFAADNRVFTLNVGDSRIFATMENSREEGIRRLTVDDSLEEAVGGHGRDLLQFIGMGEGLIPHISTAPEGIEKIVITSDGVHFVSQALLSDILINASSQNETVEQLLTVAKWRGGPDNASVAAVLTQGLLKPSTLSQGSGIEIWDPFGTLQIMWNRQEFPDAKEPVVMLGDNSEPLESPLDIPDSHPIQSRRATNKKPRNTKKGKAKKKSKQPSLDQGPQIEIVIGPVIDSPTKEDES